MTGSNLVPNDIVPISPAPPPPPPPPPNTGGGPITETPGTASTSADALYAQTFYTPAHLQQIRDLYVAGSPITLPAQLEGERDQLDAAKKLATLSPSAATPSQTPSASVNVTSRTASPLRTPSSAGTAGSTSSAQ